MLCQTFDIGDAKTIAEDHAAFQGKPQEVLEQTLKHLAPGVETIVRMETARRAALHLLDNSAAAKELVLRLCVRALEAQASGKPNAEAWFDAGYAIATFRQVSMEWTKDLGNSEGIPGFMFVKKALELNQTDAAMHFAAALMTHAVMRTDGASYGSDADVALYRNYAKKATELATKDSPLARNVKAHLVWDDEMRKYFADKEKGDKK
jgi:hypothetical protein